MGKEELKKGPWTREEDQKLLSYIQQNGHGSWRALPAKAGLQRCGKSCRLRWTNYLRPDIKRGKFSSHEEKSIIRLHALLGNRWSAIATHLPKRTDNEIKNYWNTRLKKRLTRMGIDPVTHKPKSASGSGAAVVSHMAQWETARLEAEARLARESRLLSTKLPPSNKTTAPPPPATPSLDVLKVWQGSHMSIFTSINCHDSPTSTLSFSSNCTASINGAPLATNGIVLGNNCSGGGEWGEQSEMKMEDSVEVICGGGLPGTAAVAEEYSNYYEESKNYWNELMSLVNSPTESGGF